MARIVIGAGMAALALRAGAQISPGPLSRAHEKLDGNRGCLSCHSPEKGVDPALCFRCHTALSDRVAAGQGLHARADYVACERCHPEHGGRDFVLVDWPGGRDTFDHARTGYALEGKHAGLACGKCHKPEAVSQAVRKREPDLVPSRTFLGLATGCVDCHLDPHRGSMKAASCTECHTQTSWKVEGGFDHSKTRYPLEGRHARVACLDCHKQPQPATVTTASGTSTLIFDQFRSADGHPACSACHRDPHLGRLGASCESCHDLNSFHATVESRFDHERTAYPLRGRHRTVECAKCHTAGRELRVPGYLRCESCHTDPHFGQLRSAAGGGACADCHTVDTFRPARFGLEAHSRSRFDLRGAHRAIPCSACHREVPARSLPRPWAAGSSARALQFKFASTACRDCHRDPHGGELDRFATDQGCASCHDQERWRPARFDHTRARFALLGSHARVDCAKCHPGPEKDSTRRFDGRPLDCAGCHRDVHAGQFAVSGTTNCARCHDQNRFRPASGFDHASARFKLDARHLNVPCQRCHPSERSADGPLVRYKPRPLECTGCHAPAEARG